MLEELKKLKGTVTDEQLESLEEVAGGKLFKLFESALDASGEDEARTRVDALSLALNGEPLKAFKLYNKLDAAQKGIILGLMEDQDE